MNRSVIILDTLKIKITIQDTFKHSDKKIRNRSINLTYMCMRVLCSLEYVYVYAYAYVYVHVHVSFIVCRYMRLCLCLCMCWCLCWCLYWRLYWCLCWCLCWCPCDCMYMICVYPRARVCVRARALVCVCARVRG